MIRCTALTFSSLILLMSLSTASADALDRATQDFLAVHPTARFVEDGAAHRWYIVHGFATATVKGDFAGAAERFLVEHRALLGLDNAASGVALDRVVAHRDHRYYQFEQTLGGLPVFGAGVVVQIDGHGRIVKASSKALASAPDGTAGIGPDQAVAAARVGLGGVEDEPLDVTLGYLPEGDGARLVYRVVARGAPMHLWQTFVDARSGLVALRYDLIRRHDANVFLENPVVDEETTTQVFLPNIEAGENENHTFGSYARTATCTSTDMYGSCVAWEHHAVADTNGFLDELPLLDDPTESPDGFAEIMAYYHLDDQNQWVRDEFGFDGMFVDAETEEEGTQIWAHTSIDWYNAAFSGGWGGSPDSIIFGQGSLYSDPVDFAYDGDVIRHEFTHAVSSKAFNMGMGRRDELGLDTTVQGIEEGTADYYAATVAGNAQLSEYALGDSGRNLDNEHVCPDDLVGESHYDGWIVGGTLWEMREALGATKVDHLHYSTLIGEMIWTFDDYAAAVVAQAEAMQSEVGELQFTADDVAVVEQVIADRGLEGCVRVVSLWEGDEPVTKLHYMGWDITTGQGTPSSVQYLAPTFDDTAVLKLLITVGADAGLDVLVRKDEPVQFEWTNDDYPFTWEATYDYMWSGPLTEATISNITEIELEPGADYYFSLLCKATTYGCQNYVTMSLSTEPEDPPEDGGPDADTDADTDADAGADAGTGKKSDSGCGCRVGGAETRSLSLLDVILEVI